MAHSQIYSCLFLFLIISCQAIPLAEGRQLKSLKKQGLDHNKDKKDTETHARHNLNAVGKLLRTTDNLQVSPAGGFHSAGLLVSEKKATFPPQAPTRSQGDGNSEVKAVTAFRPTMPGNSPGAGHSFTEHGLDFKSEAVGNISGTPQSSAADGNRFRPTRPGNSPSAGNSTHNQIAKPTA